MVLYLMLFLFRRVKAYSLIELVVVLTILSMISLMTLPNYGQWIKRFRYWEIMQEIQPIKLQVEWCYWQYSDLSHCHSSAPGFTYTSDAASLIEAIEIDDGMIHITPKNIKGLQNEDDLWLKPIIRKHRLIWHYSGGAVRKSYVRT